VVFWTRDPAPLIPRLSELDDRGIAYYFLYTLLDYPRPIDPGMAPLVRRIGTFRELSDRIGPDRVADRIRERVGDHPAYLSFDIDGLDPAFAPGTGTPVWGGLSAAQAAAILRGIAGVTLVGGDVVEVSPPFDPAGITAVAAAHVATEILCLWGWTRRK